MTIEYKDTRVYRKWYVALTNKIENNLSSITTSILADYSGSVHDYVAEMVSDVVPYMEHEQWDGLLPEDENEASDTVMEVVHDLEREVTDYLLAQLKHSRDQLIRLLDKNMI